MRLATTITLALAMIATATPAAATVARFLPLEEHVALADAIVRVRITGEESFVSKDDGRPRTDTRMQVVQGYKGRFRAGDAIKVRQMRGRSGETELRIPGDPELRNGDELILFLQVAPDEMTYLTALAQSKYVVVRDLSGAWVKRDFDGLAFTFGDDGRVVEAVPESGTPLDLFEKTLALLIEKQQNGQQQLQQKQ